MTGLLCISMIYAEVLGLVEMSFSLPLFCRVGTMLWGSKPYCTGSADVIGAVDLQGLERRHIHQTRVLELVAVKRREFP